MNYCFVLQSRFWIYTMLFGFYMDMYILTLLASRFLRSNIRMSFKNYSCTCSCCFWRSSLCTCTFWLKYIRHSYVAALYIFSSEPNGVLTSHASTCCFFSGLFIYSGHHSFCVLLHKVGSVFQVSVYSLISLAGRSWARRAMASMDYLE